MESKSYLSNLLTATIEKGASDLHINVGLKPHLRIDGELTPMAGEGEVTVEQAEGLVNALLNQQQREVFMRDKEIDLGYTFKYSARFRANVYHEKGLLSAAFRLIPAKIRTIEELEIPPILHDFAKLSQGLVLAVGPSGHGKSTTLAAILDEINKTRKEHIITIEDPIEYIFNPDKSVVSQREVGVDTPDFGRALKSVLRQDPDVVMVGEMRDAESISAAMTAAETGHLVFSTLHTNSAAQTIDRIIDVFPAEKQSQVAMQLAATLSGIVSKRLIPKIGGGRVPACEVMLMNPAIRSLIRDRKTHQIDTVIETNLKFGMIGLGRSLADLVKAKKITKENAELYTLSQSELRLLMESR